MKEKLLYLWNNVLTEEHLGSRRMKLRFVLVLSLMGLASTLYLASLAAEKDFVERCDAICNVFGDKGIYKKSYGCFCEQKDGKIYKMKEKKQ